MLDSGLTGFGAPGLGILMRVKALVCAASPRGVDQRHSAHAPPRTPLDVGGFFYGFYTDIALRHIATLCGPSGQCRMQPMILTCLMKRVTHAPSADAKPARDKRRYFTHLH